MNIHTAVVNTKNKKILKENAVKFISADSNGAETVFIGRVRNENSGKKVTAVTYDAHDQMVLKSFNSICELCNRVRVTCTGIMYMCLGQQDKADLITPLRKSENNDLLKNVIFEAISRKPKGHDFVIDREQEEIYVPRHMNVTGG